MADAVRVLLRGLSKLLRPLAAGGRLRPARLAKAVQSLRSSFVALRPRPGPLVHRLLPDVISRRLARHPGPPDEDEEIERPSEADLPEAVVGADGLPIQQAILVAVPLEIAYNQFTQFEDFPGFMRAVAKADQLDPVQVRFECRRWGLRRSFLAHIVDQRPEERIAWRSVEGMRLAGVTTFHSVADRLTQVDVSVVVEASDATQRIAHRLGLVERAIAGELSRFKAFVEMREEETGAWRGYIADGKVVDEDEYFGWEPSEDDSEQAPPKEAGSPPSEADAGASAGTAPERRSGGKAARRDTSTKEATTGRRPARNGASASQSGDDGASKGRSDGRGRERAGADEKTGSSRSRA